MPSAKARPARLRSALILGAFASVLAAAQAAHAQTSPPGVGPAANPPPGVAVPNAPPGGPAPVQVRPVQPVPAPATPAPAPVPVQLAPGQAAASTPISPAPLTAPAPLPAPVPVAPPPSAAAAPAPPPAVYPTPQPSPPPAAASGYAPPPAVYPPQPPAALPPESLSDDPEPKGDGPSDCLIGEFCLGPMLTGGVLNVFGLGVHARMKYWGLGFDYQFINLGYNQVDGNLRLVTLEGRVYPGGGAFYFTAGMSWQSISFQTPVNVTVQNITQRVNVKGSTVIPLFKLGLGFMGRDGFVMGIDLGIGFRLNDVEVDLATDVDELLVMAGLDTLPQVVQARAEFKAAAEEWIEYLPFTLQFNVLRIGYLF